MRYSYYKDTLKNYVKNNYKEYLLVCILFLIGIFVGVMIINNCKDAQLTEITTYYLNHSTYSYENIIQEIDIILDNYFIDGANKINTKLEVIKYFG